MGKPFKGVINVDIRDSVPDWVGHAIGLTQLPAVSRQAVYDVLRALTDGGTRAPHQTVRFRRWRHA